MSSSFHILSGRAREPEERRKKTKLIVNAGRGNTRIRKRSRRAVIHPSSLIIFQVVFPSAEHLSPVFIHTTRASD